MTIIKNGCVGYYFDKNKLIIAGIKQTNNKFASIVNSNNQNLSIPVNRIQLLPLRNETKYLDPKYLKGILGSKSQFDKDTLNEIYEKAVSDNEYTLEEIAKLKFEFCTIYELIDLRLSLIKSPWLFTANNEVFVKVSKEKQDKLIKKNYEKIKLIKKKKADLKAIKNAIENSIEISNPDENFYINTLKAYLTNIDYKSLNLKSENIFLLKSLKEVLPELSTIKNHNKALNLVATKLSFYKEFKHLIYYKHQITKLELENDSSNNIYKDIKRTDLTHLDTISVDDYTTTDIDDALSFEILNDQMFLYIHIADASNSISKDSAFDKEIMKRGSSIYTADNIINMITDKLVTKISLNQDETKEALTIKIELDAEYGIKDYSIFSSMIKVKNKYNYQESDQLLENADELLNHLYQAASKQEIDFIDKAGFKSNRPENKIKVDQEFNISFELVNNDSFSRKMISELMILSNRLFGEFLIKNNIPGIFRYQEPQEGKVNQELIDNLTEQPVREYYKLAGIKPSKISFEPLLHWGLGINGYIQGTSPIRRYHDLVNQRQIIHFLEFKEVLYSKSDLENVINHSTQGIAKAKLVSNEVNRFWLFTYLKNKKKADKDFCLEAVVIRNDQKYGLVYIYDLLIQRFAFIKKERKAGDKVSLKITNVSPKHDKLIIEEAE